MKSTIITQDAIDKIIACEELIKEKEKILLDNGININKNTKESFQKLERFEVATKELTNKARAYAGLLTGLVALPLAGSQIIDYSLGIDENAMIKLAIKISILMITYRISYLTNEHINIRIKAQEFYGSYKNYLEAKRKQNIYNIEGIHIMDKIDYIASEKEKLQGYKQIFTDYINHNGYISNKDLTNYLLKTNNKVSKLTRKLSTIQPNNDEFIDFK